MNEFAFPVVDQGGPSFRAVATGMTLRDYFAAAALTGILSSASAIDDTAVRAQVCYAFADSMLDERARRRRDQP